MQAPQLRRQTVERVRHAGLTLLLALHLSSCAHTPPPPQAEPAPASPPAASAPQPPAPPSRPRVAPRPWADEILYFVVVDRFADGDTATNVAGDTTAQG